MAETRKSFQDLEQPSRLLATLDDKTKDNNDNDDLFCEEEDDNKSYASSGAARWADTEEIKRIGHQESRAVRHLRLILVTVMAIVAVFLSLSVYRSEAEAEMEDFQATFTDHAIKLRDAFRSNAARRLGAMNSFSNTITSHALSVGDQWPNVTLPDFERRAAFTMELSEMISIALLPIVTSQNRVGWESYSVQHQQWFTEGLAVQAQQKQAKGTENGEDDEQLSALNEIQAIESEMQIKTQLHGLNASGDDVEFGYDESGPFVVWWQFAPVFPFPNIVNYNTLSHPTRANDITAILKTSRTLVGSVIDMTPGRKAVLNLLLNRLPEGGAITYQEGPVSDIYVPVFDNYGKDRQLVAILTSYVHWQLYFEKVLPENANGIIAILENSCNQSYTYSIHGQTATYLGEGDLHDPTYDDLEVSTDFGAFLDRNYNDNDDNNNNTLEGECLYKIRIFPSKEMEVEYLTKDPLSSAIVFLAVFLVTSLVFMCYDCLVERRQKVVMKQAVQSTQVVQSLFFSTVRDRLPGNVTPTTTSERKNGKDKDVDNDDDDNIDTTMESAATAAIADSYEECTVLFADLAGFTKWSSGREPSQVFRLLETIYGAFDKIAQRRRVFKIETIGDCYLAVTGLPQPQRDHAVIMARFAAECSAKMNHLTHKLVDVLGPETSTLTMRVGMHSGKVTAGVLRGARARFQIFGDTVNTAARMESTGTPGKIQASQATADCLIHAGKADWVVLREETIEAKGKGVLQTYWIQPKVEVYSSSSCNSLARTDSTSLQS